MSLGGLTIDAMYIQAAKDGCGYDVEIVALNVNFQTKIRALTHTNVLLAVQQAEQAIIGYTMRNAANALPA